jgi:hypothetical protein
MWEFWEYLTRRGDKPFTEWRAGLPSVERAILDEKMRLLEKMGPEVSCLKGPLRGYRHIYKIRVQGPTVALRPLLCLGPINKAGEFTMLSPMTEVGGNDTPSSAKSDAEARRVEIVGDKTRRVRYGVPKP